MLSSIHTSDVESSKALSEHKFWLGFSLITGIGLKRILGLLNEFGSLGSAWSSSETRLRQSSLENNLVTHFIDQRKIIDLDQEMAKVARVGAQIIVYTDADYPTQLKAVDAPPPVLYVRGNTNPADQRALAVVGTRKATKYGRDAAYDICYQLAKNGVTIISGMAHGIDQAAHSGALDSGGRTIAVLGNGVDICYPRDHIELGQKIIHQGALISEFPIGASPVANNFPRRNRIVSGLSLGVLVVEAPENSGALITATLAADQGRDVFAIPGNIYNGTSRGSNRLIQDGAKLVMDAKDILDELNVAHEASTTRVRTEVIAPSNGIEAKLLAHMSGDPIHIDDLVRLSGLSINEVSSTLTILELKGMAQMVGHMQYCLC